MKNFKNKPTPMSAAPPCEGAPFPSVMLKALRGERKRAGQRSGALLTSLFQPEPIEALFEKMEQHSLTWCELEALYARYRMRQGRKDEKHE